MKRTSNRRTLLRGATAAGAVFVVGNLEAAGNRTRNIGAQDNDPLTIALLDTHAERLESTFDAFSEQLESEIDVTPLSYAELYNDLSIALTQRSPSYDVVSLDDAWIPQFASFLTPIEPDSELIDRIVPIASELARFPDDAAPCGLPWLGDAQFFASRPNWLADAAIEDPDSWDETLDAANSIGSAFDADEGIAGFAISTLSSRMLIDSFLPILRGCGTDLIDPETSVPQLDTPAALEAVALFQQLAVLSPPESAATGAPTNTERFQVGNVAMMSNFWASDLLSATGMELDRDVGPIACGAQPAQPGIERMSMPGVWIAGIPIGSERPGQASAFLNLLLSDSTQRALVEVGLPPVFESTYLDKDLVAAQPHLPQLLDLLAQSSPRPRSPYYLQLELLLANELEAMLEGAQSGEDAVRNANIAMREFLAREGVLEL